MLGPALATAMDSQAAAWRGAQPLMLVAEEGAEAAAPPAEGGKKQVAETGQRLREAVAEGERKLAEVRAKLEADHHTLESKDSEKAAAVARIAELERALADERNKLAGIEREEARIEREHNGDHDREEALAKELAVRRQALQEFDAKQKEIARLEKEAEGLRRRAEELRKRAEELREQ